MSVITFELTEDHIKVLKYFKWSINDKGLICSGHEDDITPIGGNDIYEDLGLIIYGKPEGFDPLGDEPPVYPQEQMDYMDKLYTELPTALNIILYLGKAEAGTYKTKFHDINWKKQNG